MSVPGDKQSDFTVSISIDNQDRDKVAQCLSGATSGTDASEIDRVIGSFVQLAVDEHIDWILGRDRYRSLSELQIERIGAIFREILPDEVPKVTRLYNDFSLSYGQAMYVARVLSDRELSTWRDKARQQLIGQINSKLVQARKNVQQGRGETAITLKLTKLAGRELDLAIEQSFLRDELVSPLKRLSSAGDLAFVEIDSGTLLIVAETLGLL